MHGQLLPSGRFAAAPDCYSCRRGRRLRLCYDRSFWAGAKQLLKATDYFSQPEAAAGVRNGCTAIQSLIAINKICLPRTIFLPPRVFFLRRSRLTGTSLPSAAARARARSQGTNVVGNLHPRALLSFVIFVPSFFSVILVPERSEELTRGSRELYGYITT